MHGLDGNLHRCLRHWDLLPHPHFCSPSRTSHHLRYEGGECCVGPTTPLSRTYRSWGAERKMQRLDEIYSCHLDPPSSQHRDIAKCRSNLALPSQDLKALLDRWRFQLSLGEQFPAALSSEMQCGTGRAGGFSKTHGTRLLRPSLTTLT